MKGECKNFCEACAAYHFNRRDDRIAELEEEAEYQEGMRQIDNEATEEDPIQRLDEAMKRIAELEAENINLRGTNAKLLELLYHLRNLHQLLYM